MMRPPAPVRRVRLATQHRMTRALELPHHAVRGGLVEICRHDFRARGGKRPGDLATDAARGAGHQDTFAFHTGRSIVADLATWRAVQPTAADVLLAIDSGEPWQVSFWDAVILTSAAHVGATIPAVGESE